MLTESDVIAVVFRFDRHIASGFEILRAGCGRANNQNPANEKSDNEIHRKDPLRVKTLYCSSLVSLFHA
jgi:hypothetical protein